MLLCYTICHLLSILLRFTFEYVESKHKEHSIPLVDYSTYKLTMHE